MHGNPLEIEHIVRLVLDRLRAGSVAPLRTAQNAILTKLAHPALQAAEPNQSAGTLRLDTKLVTLNCVEGKLNGVQVLQVPPQAVVTPSVLDELRHRKIRFERKSLPSISSRQSVSSRLLLVLDTSRDGFSDYAGQLITGSPDYQEVAGRIAKHITGGGHFAIWAANRPYAAALACARITALRSIQLSQIAELARAQSEAEPNVVLVDGMTWDASQIRELTENLSENQHAGASR